MSLYYCCRTGLRVALGRPPLRFLCDTITPTGTTTTTTTTTTAAAATAAASATASTAASTAAAAAAAAAATPTTATPPTSAAVSHTTAATSPGTAAGAPTTTTPLASAIASDPTAATSSDAAAETPTPPTSTTASDITAAASSDTASETTTPPASTIASDPTAATSSDAAAAAGTTTPPASTTAATPLGLFKPASRIRAPASLGRDLQPFYVRLRQLDRLQNKQQATPWSDELAKSDKLFQFPIDNEREKWRTLEKNVTFADYIDFDDYLQWVPVDGPVCAFMDLIVVGLSHNYTMTVAKKREIIKNFRNHFANHVDDDHLFPPHDLDRCKAEFAKIEGETPLLSSFIEDSDLPLYEAGVGPIAAPYTKIKKIRR